MNVRACQAFALVGDEVPTPHHAQFTNVARVSKRFRAPLKRVRKSGFLHESVGARATLPLSERGEVQKKPSSPHGHACVAGALGEDACP